MKFLYASMGIESSRSWLVTDEAHTAACGNAFVPPT
jgi:hypothetical protein